MSDTKISALPPYVGPVSPLGDVPISIGGTTYKISPSQLTAPPAPAPAIEPVPFGQKRVLCRGWKPGTTPGPSTINYSGFDVLGDICIGAESDGTFVISRWTSGTDINDPANHTPLISLRNPLPGEPGYEP